MRPQSGGWNRPESIAWPVSYTHLVYMKAKAMILMAIGMSTRKSDPHAKYALSILGNNNIMYSIHHLLFTEHIPVL